MPQDAENEAKDGNNPSGARSSKPSSTKGKTYSETEVKELLSQRHSTLDTRIATLEKENRRLKTFETAATEAEAETETVRTELARVKGEFAKKDPDFKSIYASEEQNASEAAKLKKERRKLEADKAEMQGDIETAQLSKHEKAVNEAAKAAGVSAELLLTIVPKPQEGQDLKAIASKLPKVKAAEAGDEDAEETSEEENSEVNEDPWNPDSGLSTGGEGEVTNEKLEKADMKSYAKMRGHDKLVKK